jgi:hypothetical protein
LGDVNNYETVEGAIRGVDAVAHLIALNNLIDLEHHQLSLLHLRPYVSGTGAL